MEKQTPKKFRTKPQTNPKAGEFGLGAKKAGAANFVGGSRFNYRVYCFAPYSAIRRSTSCMLTRSTISVCGQDFTGIPSTCLVWAT